MKHGSGVTYRKDGCRCDDCKRAAAADMADYRKRRYLARGATTVHPAGTVRRLEALAVMGWSIHDIGERCGMTPSAVARVRSGEYNPLLTTARRIAAVYDELSMTPGPSPKARTWALRRGWLGPLHWDDATIDDPAAWATPGERGDNIVDPVVVDRLLAGRMTWRDATYADRLEAARRVIGRPGGPKFCEVGLGLNSSTIARIRQEAAA